MLTKSSSTRLFFFFFFLFIFIFNLPLFEQASYQPRRYVHVALPSNWSSAQKYCREHHTDLATFRNSDDFDAQQSLCRYSRLCWIGLQRDKDDSNVWNWSDGEESNFTKWRHDQPDDYLGAENCVVMEGMYWNDLSCDRYREFLCYENSILVKENKTWEEALEHCRTLGTDSSSSNKYLNHRFDLPHMDFGGSNSYAKKEIQEAQTAEVWIGLRFLAGEWLWVNGMPLLKELPACPVPGLYCGTMSKTGELLQMRNCLERRNFFCS
ncbi:hypothetical protein VZT92_000946 [Zoarces viviparus]|uniref:C-type lectin domain-containing protein n=1 Tax=Zoarces viviparus TaxID=48416 RepID=A0AAW1G9U3_ZOAVI